MGLTAGTRLGPYEILSLLGAGGMGEVYRARDDRLARDVAIKILPDAWLADPERRARFDREARLLAQLNHPHVGAIYGIEDQGGVCALVLELVEGPTLQERLEAGDSGPGLDEALAIARQIAGALEAAHEKGIVHRDLKPANIIIQGAWGPTPTRWKTAASSVDSPPRAMADIRVKVIDFGLAKLGAGGAGGAGEAGGNFSQSTLGGTRDGVILGTVAYMSPEQARGQPVDRRSDIWSFGCVLYEMLAGRSPFQGDSVADVLAAILGGEPDWRALPNDTPPSVERLLRRCLEKDHTRRLRDIGEARIEIEAAERAATASSIERSARPPARAWVTLVILPFNNLSNDPEQEYFSDGLMDETISALGQMSPERLRVVARTSSMAYKKTTKTAGQIGKELRADYLVESSVRREADRVRITTQLIRVEDEIQVWSARFDRTPESVLGVQDEIGRAIASQVHGKLSLTQQERLPRRPTQNPEAYDLYLRGKYHWHRFAIREAIASFEAAVESDPSSALAYAGLAWTYSGMPIQGDAEPLEYLQRSRRAAEKALALDPQLAEGHAAAGWADFWSWNWPRAEQSLRRAIELNPNYALARFYLAHLLSNWFRHDEAIEMILQARDLDPLSPIMYSFHGQFLFDGRRYSEAIESIQRAIAIDPGFFHGHEILSRVHLQLGDLERALAECEKSYEMSGGMLFAFARKGYVLAKMGRLAEAEQVLATLRTLSTERFVAPLNIAVVHAGLGHREATLDCLEKAVDVHAVQLVLLPTDPVWDEYRDEPRFRALIRKCGFRETAA